MERDNGWTSAGYTYAFGTCDDNVIKTMKSSDITYAKTTESTHKFDIPSDFLRWNLTHHHDEEKLFELDGEFLLDLVYFSLYSTAKLFYAWGYKFDQNGN